jgi:hypothetical protein
MMAVSLEKLQSTKQRSDLTNVTNSTDSFLSMCTVCKGQGSCRGLLGMSSGRNLHQRLSSLLWRSEVSIRAEFTGQASLAGRVGGKLFMRTAVRSSGFGWKGCVSPRLRSPLALLQAWTGPCWKEDRPPPPQRKGPPVCGQALCSLDSRLSVSQEAELWDA